MISTSPCKTGWIGPFTAKKPLIVAGSAARSFSDSAGQKPAGVSACGAADDKTNGAAPDTTPNGSITTQPDTNGTDTGSAKDDLNGGHNESGRADEDGQMDGTVETRRYDRALAASLSQLILNRIGE